MIPVKFLPQPPSMGTGTRVYIVLFCKAPEFMTMAERPPADSLL
jgi:hypothetical protein